MAPGVAHAQTASCTNAFDAPWPAHTYSCNNACTSSGTTWTCDMGAVCSGAGAQADATIVHDYDGNGLHDYVAWGECPGGTGDFCCTHDEQAGSPVYRIHLIGTDNHDERLSFHWNPGGGGTISNLAPARSHWMHGFIYGRAGNDALIQGSDHWASNYRDNLYGEKGDDFIVGLADYDWISGGEGDDILFGNEGADRIVGGEGDDELVGGNGHDTLCDTTGDLVCITAGAQLFLGGSGNDTFWHDDTASCPTTDLSAASDAGAGTDSCGDETDFAALWMGCDTPITSEPAECADPN